jgi:hypothetical protein
MMIKLIKSRYGVNRLITEEADGSLTIEGDTAFSRYGWFDDKTIEMFDFEGGPFIMVGDPLLDFDYQCIVESIEILETENGRAKIKVRCK